MGNEKIYFEKIAERGQLVVISGPSGVGKRTVISEYMKEHPNAIKCTSVTTREPHEGEVDGVDYHFISHKEFDQLIRSKQMLEYSYYNRNRHLKNYENILKLIKNTHWNYPMGKNLIFHHIFHLFRCWNISKSVKLSCIFA